MDRSTDRKTLSSCLNELLAAGKLFCIDGYYSLADDPALVQRRREGNGRAVPLLRIAERIGRRLYCFPFVRAVGVSGSLSKDYADKDADIDFFIITKRNRLWIARTLLHGLKKISFLFGKQDWYCMNYFVDEDALVIAEKNVFTATEVVTLKPVSGDRIIQDFYVANGWTKQFLPNHQTGNRTVQSTAEPWYKMVAEWLFDNRVGAALDAFLMRITASRWTKKEALHKMNSKGNPLALIADQHFARPNPSHFQRKILDSVKERTMLLSDNPQATPVFSAMK